MNTPGHAAHHRRRQAAALPRWRKVAKLRAKGHTFAVIAARLGIDVAMAHRLEQKWHSYRLDTANRAPQLPAK